MTSGTTAVPDPAVLARAFLALGDGAPTVAPRRTPAAAIVLLTAVVLAMSTPLVWAGLVADQPDTAVLTPPRVALVDGDDDAPGGR